MDNRFYLQALGVSGLFISLLLVFWVASGGPAGEVEVQNASNTRTAIALTEVFLLKPFRTDTPPPFDILTFVPVTETSDPALTNSPVNTTTSPPPQNTRTPTSSITPSFTPLPTQTVTVEVPTTVTTVPPGRVQRGARAFPRSEINIQAPTEFVHWYFTRVWQERDYQNLWDNYLTASFKSNIGTGIFDDYAGWWNSVEQVEVISVEVLENNSSDAWVRVNLTFHMKDGRVVSGQISEYDLRYDTSRGTWMFDASP